MAMGGIEPPILSLINRRLELDISFAQTAEDGQMEYRFGQNRGFYCER
jgi:hypothetical protein